MPSLCGAGCLAMGCMRARQALHRLSYISLLPSFSFAQTPVLSFAYVQCMCMHACSHTCGYVHMFEGHAYVYMCLWRAEVHIEHLQLLPTFHIETGPLTGTQTSLILTSWL